MGNENGNDIYGLGGCLDILRDAASRALELQIQAVDDPRLTLSRRVINAQNLLNLWLRTETLNHQRLRHVEPLKQSEQPSQQAAPVVFKLHQTGETNNETN